LADEFIAALKQGYLQKTRREAEVYKCQASRGAHVEKLK